MLIADFFHIEPLVSLAVVVGFLGTTVLLSVLIPPKKVEALEPMEPPVPPKVIGPTETEQAPAKSE